jgi:hypothetical protein
MFELLGNKNKVNRPLPDSDHPAISGASGALQGRIESEHGVVVAPINPGNQPIGASLSIAEKIMKNIATLDDRGRDLVVADALEDYNSDWRFGERINDGGIMEMFEKPQKSKAEFCASLTLSTVQITGSEHVTLRFACEDLPLMRNFCVTSSDGVDFNDVRVELQGGDAPSVAHQANRWH